MKTKVPQIFQLSFYKFIKNPWSLIFGIVFPIVWTIIVGKLWGSSQVSGAEPISVMDFLFPAVIMMMILTFSLSSIPIILTSDRINKRVKQLSLANVSKHQYLFGIALFNYCFFLAIFLVCWIIASSAFNLIASYQMILTVLFWPVIIFSIHFLIAILISNFSKTNTTAVFATFVILYFLLLVSGATIPSYIFGDWFKYLQYLTPSGCGILIMTACANGLNQTTMFPAYLILAGYGGVLGYLALKFFSWE